MHPKNLSACAHHKSAQVHKSPSSPYKCCLHAQKGVCTVQEGKRADEVRHQPEPDVQVSHLQVREPNVWKGR